MSNKIRLSKNFQKDAAEGKGMVFIIPNHASGKDTTWILGKDKALSSFAEDIRNNENEQFVQIWCHTNGDKNSNWQCHGEKHLENFAFNGLAKGHFSVYLPASWLKDKKEGDVLHIDVLDENGEETLAQYALLCQQKGFRYENYGTFEEVLSRVTA